MIGTAFAEGQIIDAFFESFTLDWTRGNPQAATFLQMFQGAEQDALDRQLWPKLYEEPLAHLPARSGQSVSFQRRK